MRWKRLLFLVCLIWAAWHSWSTRTLHHSGGILIQDDPLQANTSAADIQQGDFTLTPRAQFSIAARVLSRERYLSGRTADLSPIDLALGWGPMSDSQILEKIDISQGGRFYYWRTQNPPIPVSEISSHSANMHMIPANDYVRGQLLNIRQGDLIRLQGQLVDIHTRDGWHWRTSTSRTDTGAGACEIIWVENLSLLKN